MSLLSSVRTYELPIAKSYVRHWGMVEAVREIIQNALDSDSAFEYSFTHDALFVHSRNSSLSAKTLLLGSTSKADSSDTIGSFGEGFKIALLVLTREGFPVTVHNASMVWRPAFRKSRTFDAEVLCIDETKAPIENVGLSFEIGGLTPSDMDTIRDSCLQMQKSIGEVIPTKYGRILPERKGKLYVGGLYICDTDMEYGYDLKPEFIKLERDRQTVASWDMKLITQGAWYDTERYDQIALMIEQEKPDMQYAQFDAPAIVRDACYRHFQREHPGKVMASNQKELDELVEQGMKVYVGGHVYSTVVKSSELHKQQIYSTVTVLSPKQAIEKWLNEHGSGLSIVAISHLRLLSEKWTNK